MIPSGLTSPVIYHARVADDYVRVRDSGVITAVAQFLYDEAALLDEWRLDEWLALFDRDTAEYLIPSPEDFALQGPAGLATPDDLEAFEACQSGLRTASGVPWSDISRGMHRERCGGPGRADDDLQICAFWREWQKLMNTYGG